MDILVRYHHNIENWHSSTKILSIYRPIWQLTSFIKMFHHGTITVHYIELWMQLSAMGSCQLEKRWRNQGYRFWSRALLKTNTLVIENGQSIQFPKVNKISFLSVFEIHPTPHICQASLNTSSLYYMERNRQNLIRFHSSCYLTKCIQIRLF